MLKRGGLDDIFSHTFVKSGSPSLTRGMEGKVRSGFMMSVPFCRVKRLDMTTKRSEVFFTGRKRLRGTFMPASKT